MLSHCAEAHMRILDRQLNVERISIMYIPKPPVDSVEFNRDHDLNLQAGGPKSSSRVLEPNERTCSRNRGVMLHPAAIRSNKGFDKESRLKEWSVGRIKLFSVRESQHSAAQIAARGFFLLCAVRGF